MALRHWTFLYSAQGLPAEGDIRVVTTATSVTVLAGFPGAATAVEACTHGAMAKTFAETQLVELCGGFSHEHVAALRRLRGDLPVGLVTYAGNMTNQLHAIFG